jgi:hypothetical protein
MYDSKELVPECSSLSLDCYAECDCDPGYDGTSNCALGAKELEERNSFRATMISGILTLTSLEDNTESNVVSWVNAMNNAAVKSDELSEESAMSMLSFANSTMSIVSDNALSTSSLDSLLTTINTVSEVIVQQQSATRRKRERRILRRKLEASVTTENTEARNAGSKVLEVLQSYGKVVAASMIPGQFPETQTSDYFHMQYGSFEVASSSASNLDETTSTSVCDRFVAMELPQSSREKALGYTANQMLIPTCRQNMTSTNLAATSVSSQLYGDAVAGSFDSNPLSLHLSSFPCNEDDVNSCQVQIVIPRSVQLSSPPAVLQPKPSSTRKMPLRSHRLLQSSYNVEEIVEVACLDRFVGNLVHTCLNGLNVTVSCDGSASTVKTKCPKQRLEPTCSMFEGVRVDNKGPRCQMLNYTETNITCACSLLPPAAFSAITSVLSPRERRTLLSTSEYNSSISIPQGEYTVNYVSMLQTMTDTFEQTVLSAAKLNAATIEKGWQAFVVIGTFTVFIALLMLTSHLLDSQAEAELKTLEQQEKARKNIANESNAQPIALLGEQLDHKSSHLQRLSSFFLVPNRHKVRVTSIDHIKDTIKQNSNAFGNSSDGSMSFLRIAEQALPQVLSSRFVSLATNIIVMLFIQSITYDLTKGDDGSCERLHNEVSCLEPQSAYATGASKCYWMIEPENNKYGGSCHFVQPDSDLKVIIFVAVFSAIVSTPIALAADWLIKNILSAPTLKLKSRSSTEANAASNKIATMGHGPEEIRFQNIVLGSSHAVNDVKGNQRHRRKNHINVLHLANNKMSAAITKQADEHLLNLQEDIKQYREEQLLDPILRKEYDGKP